MVLERLPKPALKKTSQASHYMHTLSIPILFRSIDISVKPTIDIYNPGCPRSWLTNIYDTSVNQWRFAQQPLRKPELPPTSVHLPGPWISKSCSGLSAGLTTDA